MSTDASRFQSQGPVRAVLPGFAFLASVLVFRLVLDILYVEFVFKYHAASYLQFGLQVEVQQYFISWILYVLALIPISAKIRQVSDYFSLTFVLALIAPLTSLYGLDAGKSIYPVLVTLLSYSIIAIFCRTNLMKFVVFPPIVNSANFAVFISVVAVGFLIFWYVISGGVGSMNLDFSRVYEFRDEAADAVDVGLLAYTNIWTYKVFALFLMCVALERRWFALFVVLLAVQLFFFGVSGHKSIVFYPALVWLSWFYFRKSSSLLVLPIVYILAVIVAFGIASVFDFNLVGSLVIRRIFFVPAIQTYEYFQFAQEEGFIYWSNSVLSFLGTYPYTDSITRVIGGRLNEGLNANNGYVSMGYVHAGLIGVIAYSLLLGALLKVLDSLVYQRLPVWFIMALMVVPLRDLIISSDLLTSLLTHGVFVSLALLLLYANKSRSASSPQMQAFTR